MVLEESHWIPFRLWFPQQSTAGVLLLRLKHLLGSLSEMIQTIWEMKILFKCLLWSWTLFVHLEQRWEQEQIRRCRFGLQRENLTLTFFGLHWKISSCPDTIFVFFSKVSHFTVRMENQLNKQQQRSKAKTSKTSRCRGRIGSWNGPLCSGYLWDS